jgi:hypothetical protein
MPITSVTWTALRSTEKAKPCKGPRKPVCPIQAAHGWYLSQVTHRPGATSQGSLDSRCIGAELLHGGYWLKVHYRLALVECATCGLDG